MISTTAAPMLSTEESRRQMVKYLIIFSVLLAIVAIMVMQSSQAGVGGLEFEDVWEKLKEWIQGTLGRIIAGSMILVGIIGGIARQSLMAFALGIGGGIGLYASPDIVESIMSATLEHAGTVTITAHQLANGLAM